MSEPHWAPGDRLGLDIPLNREALQAGGAAFLTEAFRASGALSADNRVVTITQLEECVGGSTGRKALLSVTYEKPAPDLHADLFVKFSRDFDDDVRDRARGQMELEVRFAALSRDPAFPIAVPHCYYADYQHASGGGILITQRVAFGRDGVEPHYVKCRDYEMPAQAEHYRAIVKALARLAGTHKAGRLPASVAHDFPFEAENLSVSDRAPYTLEQLQTRVARYADFAAKFPRLLPTNIAAPDFIARIAEAAPRFAAHDAAIKRFLREQPDYIALCHWNAHVDNAWFWRNPAGELTCGLMDWGHVSQMNVAMCLWGALSGAELEIWDDHLDELLTLFVSEFAACGGPALEPEEIKLHLDLYTAQMGLAWMLDAPAMIQTKVPNLASVADRFGPRIRDNERARAQLQIMSVFLNLWERHDFAASLDRFLSRS